MQTVKVYLESIDRIKEFENEIGKYDCKLEIVSGGFTADAKSIMALFLLDLSKAHDLRIMGEDQNIINKVMKGIQRFTEPLGGAVFNEKEISVSDDPGLGIQGLMCSD
ncbi:MAG: HPr family phosphocarrier protein [Dorea sp.]